MNFSSKSLICFFSVVLVGLSSSLAPAQISPGGGVELEPIFQNTVDFDLTPVFNCDIFDPTEDAPDSLEALVCTILLPDLIDDLIEAEEFCDQVFVGYRNDIPFVLREQLVDPVFINVFIGEIDGPGGTLARAGPIAGFDTNGDGIIDVPGILSLVPPPFLQARRFRAWSVPRFATIEIDLDDIPFMVFTDSMVCTAVHEAFHALGHPSTFEISNLNVATTAFGSPNFVGDQFGPNGVGFGITEFRETRLENSLAEFVPLSQADGGGHLSTFEESFFDFGSDLQEVFLPVEFGLTGFMSRTLRGMFADMGYQIRGINAFGVIDIDGDGEDDVPLIVNPEEAGE